MDRARDQQMIVIASSRSANPAGHGPRRQYISGRLKIKHWVRPKMRPDLVSGNISAPVMAMARNSLVLLLEVHKR